MWGEKDISICVVFSHFEDSLWFIKIEDTNQRWLQFHFYLVRSCMMLLIISQWLFSDMELWLVYIKLSVQLFYSAIGLKCSKAKCYRVYNSFRCLLHGSLVMKLENKNNMKSWGKNNDDILVYVQHLPENSLKRVLLGSLAQHWTIIHNVCENRWVRWRLNSQV